MIRSVTSTGSEGEAAMPAGVHDKDEHGLTALHRAAGSGSSASFAAPPRSSGHRGCGGLRASRLPRALRFTPAAMVAR
ncbi:hypothetical protein BH24ACT12_BH24ACT12_19860 [soil metagenome]|jgi:hypothetical protein